MDPHADVDWERLDRWARADGTPEELAALQQWIDTDPDLRALAQAMRSIGTVPGAGVSHWDTRGRWQRLQRQMRRAGRPLRITRTNEVATRLRTRRRLWVAVAAAVAVIVAGISVRITGAGLRDLALAHLMPMREIVTRRGERAVFDLADGSRIVLAPESRVRVPATYRPTAGPRDVYLDRGDVFFTVEHDEARPFRVHAGNGTAEDLGTEFMVTAAPDRQVRVVVVSGKVALWRDEAAQSHSRPLATLGPDQLGRLDAAAGTAVVSPVEAARLTSWVDGTLWFDSTRLDEAVRTLARWYDLDIHLADSALAGRRLTARIQTQSASQVLVSVALTLGLRVERRGGQVILSAN